jgi:hypothetical protein
VVETADVLGVGADVLVSRTRFTKSAGRGAWFLYKGAAFEFAGTALWGAGDVVVRTTAPGGQEHAHGVESIARLALRVRVSSAGKLDEVALVDILTRKDSETALGDPTALPPGRCATCGPISPGSRC